jgi:hypothetical protein
MYFCNIFRPLMMFKNSFYSMEEKQLVFNRFFLELNSSTRTSPIKKPSADVTSRKTAMLACCFRLAATSVTEFRASPQIRRAARAPITLPSPAIKSRVIFHSDERETRLPSITFLSAYNEQSLRLACGDGHAGRDVRRLTFGQDKLGWKLWTTHTHTHTPSASQPNPPSICGGK